MFLRNAEPCERNSAELQDSDEALSRLKEIVFAFKVPVKRHPTKSEK